MQNIRPNKTPHERSQANDTLHARRKATRLHNDSLYFPFLNWKWLTATPPQVDGQIVLRFFFTAFCYDHLQVADPCLDSSSKCDVLQTFIYLMRDFMPRPHIQPCITDPSIYTSPLCSSHFVTFFNIPLQSVKLSYNFESQWQKCPRWPF